MSFQRIYRLDNVNSGSILGGINSNNAPTGSTGKKLDKVWGVIKDHSWTLGGIDLEGGGGLTGSHMIAGEIYPCYPTAISVVTGSFSLLS